MSMSSEPGIPVESGAIPLCVPEIHGNEWVYIKECLDTNWISSIGSYVDRFEEALAKYVGTEYAIATVNGTAALHIALLVAGVQPDDEVLIPTLTFIAPANAIRYIGAWPVFIDAESVHWQMDTYKAKSFLENECEWRDGALLNRVTGRRVKAILPVHLLGHPVDMEPVSELANKYGLAVIEDATENLGAKYKGQMVGNLGDIACLSFNGNKLITTGGGGMILTDNEEWAQKAKYLTTQAKDDPVAYVHNQIGYNYRLSNIQAAMGCAQMERVEDFIAAKRNIATTYSESLADVAGITPMQEASWAQSIYWMYTIMIDESKYGMGNRGLLTALADAGIQSRLLWQPLHNSPAHSESQAYLCEVADDIAQKALSLPSSVGLTKDQQNRVLHVLTENRL